ncbi:4593_t:CDS:2 [Entrophospora sp. SA101]|nr:4593_t:CDS:2 [Entrophospora sp. SA101]
MELDLVDLEAEILKARVRHGLQIARRGFQLYSDMEFDSRENLDVCATLSLRPRPSSFLVLRLNFSGLRTNSTFEIFEEDFHKSLNIDMAKLMCRYRQELKDYYQIYVFIDEYDARMTEVLKNGSTLKPLIVHHKNSLSRTEAMESSFKQFYIRLKSACDNGIAYVFQTGVTPIVMSEFTSGFNISTDLALREEFWDLYGFKKVRSIFNTGSILYSTRMLTGRINYVERYKDTSIYIKKILQFSPDPHTLPSQTTMNLIVNNSLGKPILTESIGQLSLESRNGIEQRF